MTTLYHFQHKSYDSVLLFRTFIYVSFGIIININIGTITCYEDQLKYDVVDFKVLKNRNKRTGLPSSYMSAPDKDITEIQFASFGKKFHMILSEDKLFQEVPIGLQVSNILAQNITSQTKFYEGYLKENSSESNILGFLSNGSFTGKISVVNETYFIEPARIFFNDLSLMPRKIVVYRDVDIHLSNTFPHYPEGFPGVKVSYRLPNVSSNITVENSGLDFSKQRGDLFCEIEIVADHTLYNFFQKDADRLKAVLYFHAKYADYTFRRADFNMDGDPDGIRIVVGKISIYESDEDSNYPMVQASSVSEYLSLFAKRKQRGKFCLSIAVFYRKYREMTVGEAFKAQLRHDDAIGGICDPAMPNSLESNTLSFNTGVINMQFQNGKPLPLAISMLAFTHEIGHGFGSGHDPPNDPMCSPGNSNNYLMFPVTTYGSKNIMKFSKCSLEEVKEILLSKGSCLTYKNATCGNGIREDNEECDCGTKKYCNLIDPCCTPADAKLPEKGCTIRSSQGFECSPKESECCDQNCLVVKHDRTLCYSDEVDCLYSFCDGKSVSCPKPKKTPELCLSKFTCDNVVCSNATVCTSRGLKDCLCDSHISIQCLQCCQHYNKCVPAYEIGLLNSDGKKFILKPGRSCNYGNYVCDNYGNCVVSMKQNYSSFELYIGVTIASFFLMGLILLALCFSCQKQREDALISAT